LKNAAKNIWNVAKYQDKDVCRCYTSVNLFHSKKFVNCLVSWKTLPILLCKERRWCPDEAPMSWPAT